MRYIFTLLLSICLLSSNAQYTTPNTNKNWNLDSLVANSGGNITESGGIYTVTGVITISTTDTLFITTNAIVKFAVNTHFLVNGTIKINPVESVLFTAVDQAAGYNGMRLEFASAASVIKRLVFEYAISLNIRDCSPLIDSSTFRYNNNTASSSPSFGNGAISLARSSAVIRNCQFTNNRRAAIQSGSNSNVAPKIINNYFYANSTTNANVPQINLGSTGSGSDTTRILGNTIIGNYPMSGGIGFLPIGNVYAIITGNVIKHNRYGLVFNGGSNINAVISYNLIDSNNIENIPLNGGSGINFLGGTATSHQNSIVTGNIIRGNLWGITIQTRAQPNLGNLTNSDTTDDGKNWFIDNGNSSIRYDLYNNTPDDIFAQGNYWNTNDITEIEDRIYHKTDDSNLGLVNYSSYLLPVELINFTAKLNNKKVILTWQTATEINNSHFELERSDDGRIFNKVATVQALGRGSAYSYNDDLSNATQILYRLKIVDKDGRYKYSSVITVKADVKEQWVKLYPTLISNNQEVIAEVNSTEEQKLKIQFTDAEGRFILSETRNVIAGSNQLFFKTSRLPKGVVYVRLLGKEMQKTIQLIKQ